MARPWQRLPQVMQPTTQSSRRATADLPSTQSNTSLPQFRQRPQDTHFLGSMVGPQSISWRVTPANQGILVPFSSFSGRGPRRASPARLPEQLVRHGRGDEDQQHADRRLDLRRLQFAMHEPRADQGADDRDDGGPGEQPAVDLGDGRLAEKAGERRENDDEGRGAAARFASRPSQTRAGTTKLPPPTPSMPPRKPAAPPTPMPTPATCAGAMAGRGF